MTKTLLLADGSVTIQRVIELTFAHEDIRVLSVSDGRRAQQLLESERPDVILADVALPEMDGYALAAHVRRVPRLREIPLLLLASAFEPVDSDRARSVGCDGVITKPFEPQVVVDRVKELLEQTERKAVPEPVPGYDPGRVSPGPVTSFPRATEAAPPAAPEPVFRRPGSVEPPSSIELLPETLELPTHPIWQSSAPPPAPPPPPAAPASPLLQPVAGAAPPPAAAGQPPKVTLVSAFSALLAAEQSAQPAAPSPPPAISEASIEDAVRRVLVRMTDDLVRRIVIDTAERLIREEIEAIKRNPE